jgi:transforming growth factor-beta-induced protein
MEHPEMRDVLRFRSAALLLVLCLVAVACGGDDEGGGASETPAAGGTAAGSSEAAAGSSAEICTADAIVAAVEGGAEEGTLAGMADDPVATAASSNPVLTTLVTAVQAAGLVDTLNSAPALTVFAPTDCAFAALDPATMDAAMADPSGLLTTVLGYHVLPEQRVESSALSGEYTMFTGEALTVNGTDVGGQATIVVPDIMTANATVHLIDAVLLPPSAGGGGTAGASPAPTGAPGAAASATICDQAGLVAAVEGGAAEGTLAGMADDPVGTAASNNPVLTTLVTAVQAAGLVDTLNSAAALTVFAPTDCAFAAVDPATLQAALADPSGLLTQVLALHVIPGQRLSSSQLAGDYTNFGGSTTAVNGGVVSGAGIANQAAIVVPDIMTANATVHLIDQVLLPAG